MCLSTITRKLTPEQEYSRVCWKCFSLALSDPNRLYSPYWGGQYPVNRWHKAIETEAGGYTSGFHCFKTKKDAKKWDSRMGYSIMKVKVRGVHTEGTENGHGPDIVPCLVAREMLILPTIKRKGRPANKRPTEGK